MPNVVKIGRAVLEEKELKVSLKIRVSQCTNLFIFFISVEGDGEETVRE